MRIQGTHHLALTTSRFGLLRDFYVELLGLPVVGRFPGRDILFLDAGSITIELIGEEPSSDEDAPPDAAADPPGQSSGNPALTDRAHRRGWHHLAWEVEDLDAAFAELMAGGVQVHSPPESFPLDVPTMRIAFLRDPDGNLLELVQPLGSRYPGADIDDGRSARG